MSTTAKYYPINEETARRAKEMTSFRDYIPGTATARYKSMVDKAVALADAQKAKTDPMYHEKIDSLLDLYARKLAENLNQYYSIQTRCPSVMVAGGSNFPVAKKEKQNAAADRNMEEYNEIQKILDKIRGTGQGGISTDDPQALDKLRKKLADLEASQSLMKAVNAYYRKHKTLEGCPDISEDTIRKLQSDMASTWHLEDKPFASYALSNNNANIKRVRERIAELEKRLATRIGELSKRYNREGPGKGQKFLLEEMEKIGFPIVDGKAMVYTDQNGAAVTQAAVRRSYDEL